MSVEDFEDRSGATDPSDDVTAGLLDADEIPADEIPADEVTAAEPEPVEVVPTGDARVDAALARLPELDRLPTAEQVGVYEELHRSLHEALTAAQGGAAAASGSGGPRPGVPGPPRR